jgi:hypothetical protein
MGHSRIAVVALCAAALALGGCGGGDDGGDDPDRAATPAAGGSSAEPGATAEPEETASAESPEAVTKVTVDAREAGETTLDIEVLGLKVSGELATLTLQYTAHDPEATADAEYRLVDLHGGSTLFVTLVDPVNLKRYHVVEDSSGERLESADIDVTVPVDDSVTAEYTFAAPPAGVDKIDVSVGDWPTIRDVPIER